MSTTSAGPAAPPGQLGFHQIHQQQQQQQLAQQLQVFWENQFKEIEKTTDFKNHSLPLARIKKIMKADEDVRMISAEAPVVFARACEMFILELTLRSWNHTEENKRRTLQKNDIAAAVTRTDIFDFLVDIVPREDLRDEVLGSIPRGTVPEAAAAGYPYGYLPAGTAPIGNPGMVMGELALAKKLVLELRKETLVKKMKKEHIRRISNQCGRRILSVLFYVYSILSFKDKFRDEPEEESLSTRSFTWSSFTLCDFNTEATVMAISNDYGAFIEKSTISPTPSSSFPSLKGLTFAIKDIFDVEGRVTGFGNPDWLRTHSAATSTAHVVSSLLEAGATSLGITIMDEMAYSINGENAHYGTPVNPVASERVPGGSSSGSAVAVAAGLVDFSIAGTDTGGSVRVPASYCGIFGLRPSHGVVSTVGVTPMAQSFDTVGWFARDTATLKRVGCVLLQQPHLEATEPSQLIIADDCFKLCSVPRELLVQSVVQSVDKSFGGNTVINKVDLGAYIEEHVPSLKHFMTSETQREFCIPSLMALSSSMRMLQRFEFKMNHGEWVSSVKPEFGPGISERIEEAIRVSDEKIDLCRLENGVLVIPTVPGPPPHLQADVVALESFRSRAFSLLSIAGVSGLCQVSIPLGLHENLPISVSLVANHGSDGFLLSLVDSLSKFM
ncbi:hypothetical protein HID58_036772 [Brassica napus]|uniref:Uncharacterized protein n=1 Tax=Brassica napus TaxID=3708 RepID=A0ABQ8C8P9_BRANA|nr:hypothetical protein HID58_036772 [Brassica napus]